MHESSPIDPAFRMKITICTGPTFPVPAVRGGAVPRLWEGLAQEFAARGHDVTVFARSYPGQVAGEDVEGVRFVRWGGYNQTRSLQMDLAKCLLYALRAIPHVPSGDVIITNDFWLPAVLPRCRPSAGPVVACIQRFPKGQFFLYSKCQAIVAVSAAVARAIKQQTPSIAAKVQVVPNCLDEVFLRELGPARRGTGDRVQILYAGRLHPEKGLSLLAEALRKLEQNGTPDWECVLVGPRAEADGGGGSDYVRLIKELTRDLPVRLAEPIYDPQKLAACYGDADIFVYPSLAETGESFGLAPLEAMSRGLPVIVSDLAVFRDYLQPGSNGTVFDHRGPEPAGALATALRELIESPEKRRRLAEVGRRTAEEFSPGVVADIYVELMEKVITEAGHGH
jgi:glycosyltransferase involved in cell wall biosynthesis